jgi:hypothetical protein
MDLKALFRPKMVGVAGLSLTNEKHFSNVIYNKNNLLLQAKVRELSQICSI